MVQRDETVTLAPVTQQFAYRMVKLGLDRVLAFVILLLLLPILGTIALVIKWRDKDSPIFYQWRVVGLGGRYFTGYKFRTMVPNADQLKAQLAAGNEMSGPVFKMTHDPRITKEGHFLRKYSLDELPQLWSVLKGDMSLVGPRPPLQSEWVKFEPWHREKLSVVPGITCIWQISGRNKISAFDEWVQLDLAYIKEWSLWLDFKILWKTIFVVFLGSGK